MAEDAANANVDVVVNEGGQGNDAGGRGRDVIGVAQRLKRVRRWIREEISLLGRCVRSASPDRSSAIVLFLVLFGIALTCTLSRYLMSSQPERFPGYVVSWLIIIFEAAASASLVLMLLRARTQPIDVADTNLQPWHRLLRRNIKLFGIVPFYFAIFVFDVFRLIADWTCIDAWTACSNRLVYVEHITDLIYPLARAVYLCIEMVVCVRFNAADIFQNTLILAALAVVQATNLSGWLDALVDESAVFSSERNWTYDVTRCFNGVNVSTHVIQCFSRTTGEYELLEAATPYLYPFIMEYLMLVIECVADWFFSNAERQRQAPEPPQPPPSQLTDGLERSGSAVSLPNNRSGTELTQYGSVRIDDGRQQAATGIENRASSSQSVFDEDEGQLENRPLLDGTGRGSVPSTPRRASPIGVVDVDDEAVGDAPQGCCGRCPWFFVSVILSSIVSFMFVIFGIYNLFLSEVGYRNVFMFYRSSYWMALSLAALTGYAASRRFPSESMNPTGFEYFVTISCIGPILQSIFTIVANVHTEGIPVGMFLTEEITNIIQICTQVAFYGYVKNVQIRTVGDDIERYTESELARKRSLLMGVISYFAVCNFAVWVEDSFIETRSSSHSWQKQYFENWPLIYNIFNPLALVFRFNSVLLFLNVLFDKRR